MLVVVLPDRDEERAGVIRTIFMNETLIHRPTSGASAEELAAQLRDARSCTRRLTDDLSTQQLMGPMVPIDNPILWEIGHVGWFHEYWTLRHAHREAAIQQLIVPAHWQAMSMCPVGNGNSARLLRMVSSSTMKSGRMRSRSRHSGSPKRRSPTPNLPLSSRRGAIDAANSGARRDGNGASARERSIRSTGSITRVTAGRGATTIKSRRSRRIRR